MFRIKSNKLFDIVNYTLLLILLLILLYPLWYIVIASVSDPYNVVLGNVIIMPKGFTIDSYIQIFKTSEIWIGYRNSIIYTVLGTMLNLVLTIPAAYALSKRFLWHRGLITTYFVIIMFFSGGLLPTYLVVKDLELINKPYS